jgi:hypothetical protein
VAYQRQQQVETDGADSNKGALAQAGAEEIVRFRCLGGVRQRCPVSCHQCLPPAITVLFQVSFAIAIMDEFIIYFKGLWRLFRIDLVFAGDPALKYHKPPP